ncbi:hypothetical protein FPANT_13480 [Fusarium pseudoanthophilum]|uniref:LamG-like jellyroll fold domain-containing protein n=1 Tax=Fusarium pseudoanthophilum TaxID=48495 RepID=A0A8H5KH19_9HYPO|nr:hypothetical protein FPANT_13480 [Fusarium pseudoanthophilum]
MFVDSRPLFPVLQYDDQVLLNATTGYSWRIVSACPMLLGGPFPPVDSCSYRQFRLRCVYYDGNLDETSTNGPQLQLQITFQPQINIFPKFLNLSPSGIDQTGNACGVTEWFTVGSGSSTNLAPWTNITGTVWVQCINTSSSPNAALLAVDLECWDFSTPFARLTQLLPRTQSYGWSRKISPKLSVPFTFTGSDTREKIFSGVSNSLLCINYMGVRSDPPLPSGCRRGYRMRALMATTNATDVILVRLNFVDGGLENVFTFPGFHSDWVAPSLVDSTSGIWFPEFVFPLGPGGVLWASFQSRDKSATGALYQLYMEIGDYPVPNASNVELPIARKTFERPVGSIYRMTSTHETWKQEIVLKHAFTRGLPKLGPDSIREFRLRFGSRNEDERDTSAVIFLVHLVENDDPGAFHWTISADHEGGFQRLVLAPPIVFGDGRAPSIPTTDWTLTVFYVDRNQTFVCPITDLAIEVKDRPVTDFHVPQSLQLSLRLESRPLRFADIPELSFGMKSFSVALWVLSSLGSYVTEEDDPDNTTHIVCSYGKTFSIGFDRQGIPFGSVQIADGTIVTSSFDQPALVYPGQWTHIGLIWDTANLKIAVNGTLVAQGTPAAGPLSTSSANSTTLGSATFTGLIRSASFWSTAINQQKLSSLQYQTQGVEDTLIGHVEFATLPPLVIAPGSPNLQKFTLPADSLMGLECPVLAAAHLQAWFAPCAVDTSSGTNIPAFIAGKFAAVGGYSLCISGNRVMATRGVDTLFSTSTIVVDDNAVWYHAAVVVDTSTDPAIMYLYLDGQLNRQLTCTKMDPRMEIDSKNAPFTACGWLNSTSEHPFIQDSYCGYLGSIRLWRAARSQYEIVNWMYANPDPNSPSLAGSYTFDGSRMGTGGNNGMGQFMEDTILTNRTLVLPMEKLGIFLRRGQVGSFGHGRFILGATPPSHPIDRHRARRENQLEVLQDDPVTAIWIDFMVELFLAILDAIGFDIDGAADGIRAVCYSIWGGVDSVRTLVIAYSQVQQSTLTQIMTPGADNTCTLLTPYEWSKRQAVSARDIRDAGGLAEMTVGLVWRLWTTGHLRGLIKALPKVSWWSMLRFEAKLIPYVGQVYLALCIAIAIVRIAKAVMTLIERLGNEKKKSQPGLQVRWLGQPVSMASKIPLRVGGASQSLMVFLDPPSQDGPVTVTVTSSDPTITLGGSPGKPGVTLVFGQQDITIRTVLFSVATTDFIGGEPAYISTQLASKTLGGGVKASLEIRKQGISISPDRGAISGDVTDDSTTFTVAMDAIIDPGQNVKVRLSDVTSQIEDPDPETELSFNPATLIFTRANNYQHRSMEQELTVTLKKKKAVPLGPNISFKVPSTEPSWDGDGDDKAKVLQADDDNGSPSIKKKVTLTITHRAIITMLRAGKGDSYILSDKRGTDDWAYALIDGGPSIGKPDIAKVMTDIGITKFNMLNCTHYDDDHIAGLLKFLGKRDGQPHVATLALFNDPNKPSQIPTVLQGTGLNHVTTQSVPTIFPYVGDIKVSGRLGNPEQGRNLVPLLFKTCDEVARPIGRPPAVPRPGQDIMKGAFPSLDVGLYGPTTANIEQIVEKPNDSIKSNRSSTIMTFATKKKRGYDGFNVLFTGDAHDRLPNVKDIRGNTFALFNKQHFLVIKCPHHGSSDSNDDRFYHHYTAQYYLISSSYNNHGADYHHHLQEYY